MAVLPTDLPTNWQKNDVMSPNGEPFNNDAKRGMNELYRRVNNTATQVNTNTTDIAARIPTSQKGAANGVAELGSDGKVPSSQLPAFVDDVLEYDSRSAFPATGESGKIYVTKDTNKTYRWGGTEYVEISESLALGETEQTAYRGDRGKAAYDHSQIVSGNPHGLTKATLGLGNVDNTSDLDKPISTAVQTELDKKATPTSNNFNGSEVVYTVTSGTIDATKGCILVVPTSVTSITMPEVISGKTITMLVTVPSGGTVSWSGPIKWSGSTSPTVGAGDNIIIFTGIGSYWYGSYSGLYGTEA